MPTYFFIKNLFALPMFGNVRKNKLSFLLKSKFLKICNIINKEKYLAKQTIILVSTKRVRS